ncbi:von Hippel-Lindau disease tumor suppressor [Hyalella azteca]|uniref:von Hippel-Lindau disease tumor suppressor n=1 Tax=Hyalella azteca TaxID=294128 RepID=A0A8B7PPH7_HYAAZ|nr:von Hippel-Lindau disease tumor suppressor [Hyalella azteca]
MSSNLGLPMEGELHGNEGNNNMMEGRPMAPAAENVDLALPPAIVPPAAARYNNSSVAPLLRSMNSDLPSFVTFQNRTERPVDVYWVNFAGKSVLYKTLPAQSKLSVNTYETHPWIFRDHQTRAKLVVNCQEVFTPKHYIGALGVDAANEVAPLRQTFDITIPIYTLKDCATQVLLNHVCDRDKLHQLHLPSTLLQELQSAADLRDSTGAYL